MEPTNARGIEPQPITPIGLNTLFQNCIANSLLAGILTCALKLPTVY